MISCHILALHLFNFFKINDFFKPDLVPLVTGHMVYFCVLCARSEIFQTPGNLIGEGRV